MDPLTRARTKELLLDEYNASGKDLGTFALESMNFYDEVCFELKLQNATSRGKKVTGTALLPSCEAIDDFIYANQIDGKFTINLIDAQKEFFLLLEEIKRDLDLRARISNSITASRKALPSK